jgi:iron(III) transport system ATP-binding protein
VPAGTRAAVVGPSGSGKTTLLRLVAGFEAPDAGEIRLDGALLADARTGVAPHRRGIGLVMQDGALFPHLSVGENLRFGDPGPEGAARAMELLDLVGLGRGMAARRPRLMLLDEPFSALDAGLREQLRRVTAEILGRAGITTILVTHDQGEAMEFADQVAVLRGGVLRQAGPPREVYLAPVDRETAEFLGEAIILDAVVKGGVARCSLGAGPVAGGKDGPARVMLRPEQILLRGAGEGVPARVAGVSFAGPQTLVELRLVGGEPGVLAVRVPAPLAPEAGATVGVTVVGRAHALPGG